MSLSNQSNQSWLSKDFEHITPLPDIVPEIRRYRAVRRLDGLRVIIRRIGDTSNEAARLHLREVFFREINIGTQLMNKVSWQADWPLVMVFDSRPAEQSGEVYLITVDQGDEQLSHALQKNTRFLKSEVLIVVQDLIRAFEIHGQAGLVHLHITPENVYIRRNSEGTIIGAFLAGYSQATESSTHTPVLDLDSNYSAPELINKRTPPALVYDLYSIGAIIGLMIGYKQPLQPQAIAKISDRSEQERAMLAPLVARACDNDPHLRYDNGQDLLSDLERYANMPIPESEPESKSTPSWWQPKILIASIILVLLVIVVTAILLSNRGVSPNTQPTAIAFQSNSITATPFVATPSPILISVVTQDTPTAEPTSTPTAEPTSTPTAEPTSTPTVKPTNRPPSTRVFAASVIRNFAGTGSSGQVESCIDIQVLGTGGAAISGAAINVNNGRDSYDLATDASGYAGKCNLYGSDWSVVLNWVPKPTLSKQVVTTVHVDGSPYQRAAVHFRQK